MRYLIVSPWKAAAAAACVAVLMSTEPLAAQGSGHALAVQATVGTPLGVQTTRLADTGSLSSADDAREASAATGAIGGLLSGSTLHATAVGGGDQVASEASIAGLSITIAGTTISAGLVHARALSMAGEAGFGDVSIDGLAINGVPVAISGAPNQHITLPAGSIVINEQTHSSAGSVVNGLHIVITGVADVIIASAAASAQ